MSNFRDFVARLNDGDSSGNAADDETYSDIADAILTRLRGFVINAIGIAPLAELVLEYARLDPLGLFLQISAIHATVGVDVTPIGTTYNVTFGMERDMSVLEVRIYDKNEYNKCGVSNVCLLLNKYIFPSQKMYDLVAREDMVAIGNILAVGMNKPWWKTAEKRSVGTACLHSLVKKAKIARWKFERHAAVTEKK